jgi:hypothetical protein
MHLRRTRKRHTTRPQDLKEIRRQLAEKAIFRPRSERQSCRNALEGLPSTQDRFSRRDEFVDLLLLPDDRGKKAEGSGSSGEHQHSAFLERS